MIIFNKFYFFKNLFVLLIKLPFELLSNNNNCNFCIESEDTLFINLSGDKTENNILIFSTNMLISFENSSICEVIPDIFKPFNIVSKLSILDSKLLKLTVKLDDSKPLNIASKLLKCLLKTSMINLPKINTSEPSTIFPSSNFSSIVHLLENFKTILLNVPNLSPKLFIF